MKNTDGNIYHSHHLRIQLISCFKLLFFVTFSRPVSQVLVLFFDRHFGNTSDEIMIVPFLLLRHKKEMFDWQSDSFHSMWFYFLSQNHRNELFDARHTCRDIEKRNIVVEAAARWDCGAELAVASAWAHSPVNKEKHVI